ncbi:MAG: alpha/beta hydrolase [Thermoflexales bacterium]|nr:alpha/beta hydrolase [Thermoflexales bacterium]MCS7323839.1 alpha/beta hydrolase [Thermoflexales bacterium]MCX7938536.1 alpha/beta hydrolase [Thermoflexales bacterium]MDW8054576.1 alpha/beta fold hydrolase [Anaerolineae bacterium]MDW8292677.1 alpha/beta fold hydrolase [Anaerolineae bacterium]
MAAEPVVLIGGFGSHWRDYRRAGRLLAEVSGRRVFIVKLTRFSWLFGGLLDYGALLSRTHAAVLHALRQTGASKVILVGHSAGGVIGRAYLGDQSLRAHHPAYHGHQRVSALYMVGSPLKVVITNPRHRGLRAAAWVDRTYPGAYFAAQGVQYHVVRGRFIEGKREGSLRQREAYFNYRFIAGDGAQWGDGVVPLALTELEGATLIELEGVSHSPNWPRWFFADAETIRAWWRTPIPETMEERVSAMPMFARA